ncbi:MAG: MltA domain-containing protein [Planctomycetes bacterium]|nr:MltA domain-containing protein [Planctomycetota bacterium]
MRLSRALVFVAVAATLSTGCQSPKKKPRARRPNYEQALPAGMMALQKVTSPGDIPNFGPGYAERDRLLEAIERSQSYFEKPSSRKYYPYLDISHDRARRSLQAFKEVLQSASSEKDLHERIVQGFEVYRSIGYNGQGVVLFTGYCEPVYDASLTPTPEFRYPLYKLPADLVKDEEGTPLGRRRADGGIVSYFTRAEIEGRNLLAGQELVYLRDKLEAYIVHIQGSARLKLPDGTEYRVGYAGKTDRPYTSIAQSLVKEGKLKREELSLRKVKEFFAAHPEEMDRYLHQNECFVFFTHSEGGPYGSIGVPVTPYRTIATDKAVFPRGCLAYLETRLPATEGEKPAEPSHEFRSFALDQDTGGAIRSAGRADLFIGTGPEAELLAGRTQSEGRLYYIFIKEEGTAASASEPQHAAAPAPAAKVAATEAEK